MNIKVANHRVKQWKYSLAGAAVVMALAAAAVLIFLDRDKSWVWLLFAVLLTAALAALVSVPLVVPATDTASFRPLAPKPARQPVPRGGYQPGHPGVPGQQPYAQAPPHFMPGGPAPMGQPRPAQPGVPGQPVPYASSQQSPAPSLPPQQLAPQPPAPQVPMQQAPAQESFYGVVIEKPAKRATAQQTSAEPVPATAETPAPAQQTAIDKPATEEKPAKAPAGEATIARIPAGSIRLTFDDGTVYYLQNSIVVGRNPARLEQHPEAELFPFKDEELSMSKTHAVFTATNGAVIVEDLHSTNGTRVKNPAGEIIDVEPGEEVWATDGSTIIVGSRSIRVGVGK